MDVDCYLQLAVMNMKAQQTASPLHLLEKKKATSKKIPEWPTQ